jgi:hypothetical protein
MTTQQLIYENAVPVTRERHGACSVEAGNDFGFARQVNSLPLMAVEFQPAAAEYGIVFAGEGDALMPAVILGLRAQENLFVKPDGPWDGRYIPAFARRYPFIFASSPDGASFTLCIDEAFAGFNREGRGQALFDAQGAPSAYTQGVLQFLQEYQSQFLRTQAFCRKLGELGLLDPMQAQITAPGGDRMSLGGFQVVNRDRLKALPPPALADLARSDELELAYLHLQSLRNLGTMLGRLPDPLPPATAGSPQPSPTPDPALH